MRALKNAYPLVERFAVVYLVGLSLSLLAPIYLKFRTPAFYPQLLLMLAALLGILAFVRRQRRAPSVAEYLLALLACATVLAGVKFYLASGLAATAGMEGPALVASMLRRTLWESLVLAALFSPFFARALVPGGKARAAAKAGAEDQDDEDDAERAARAARIQAARARAAGGARGPRSPDASAPTPNKIPLAVGFASLGSTAFEGQRRRDAEAIGPLFAHVMTPDPGGIPTAQVLFLYLTLQPDGTIRGLDQAVGVRQVVQATGADVVVIATDNDVEAINAAIALPGPKTANIVFTLARKDDLLPRFFVRLFDEMRKGKEMLMAWVTICPQGPAADAPDMPATMLLAEAGKIAFPGAGNAAG